MKIFKKCTLTHWGRMTHMCDNSWVNIALGNGLAPSQAIIKNNDNLSHLRHLGTYFIQIKVENDNIL